MVGTAVDAICFVPLSAKIMTATDKMLCAVSDAIPGIMVVSVLSSVLVAVLSVMLMACVRPVKVTVTDPDVLISATQTACNPQIIQEYVI